MSRRSEHDGFPAARFVQVTCLNAEKLRPTLIRVDFALVEWKQFQKKQVETSRPCFSSVVFVLQVFAGETGQEVSIVG